MHWSYCINSKKGFAWVSEKTLKRVWLALSEKIIENSLVQMLKNKESFFFFFLPNFTIFAVYFTKKPFNDFLFFKQTKN
jgi:hypothetical protein